MTKKAFQKIYTHISDITKATCSLRATGVGNDESLSSMVVWLRSSDSRTMW